MLAVVVVIAYDVVTLVVEEEEATELDEQELVVEEKATELDDQELGEGEGH